MNCFEHQDMPAVGACLACGRGVCAGCAAETEGATAICCKNRCESAASEVLEARRYEAMQPEIHAAQQLDRDRGRRRAVFVSTLLAVALMIAWYATGRGGFAVVSGIALLRAGWAFFTGKA